MRIEHGERTYNNQDRRGIEPPILNSKQSTWNNPEPHKKKVGYH